MHKKIIILVACLLYLAMNYSESFASGGGDDALEDSNSQFHDPINEDSKDNSESKDELNDKDADTTNTSDQDSDQK